MDKATALRFGLAGPGAGAVAFLVVVGMALWVPPGDAGIDHVVIPLLAFPAIWACLFFHACFDTRLWRVAAVMLALVATNTSLMWLSSPPDISHVRKG